CAAAEGARKVRITGGEPLERADLADIVAAVACVPGVAEVAVTTNGVLLADRARELKGAGLDRANVSLDTLRPERFRRIAGADVHGRVMDGIAEALRTFDVVKVNTVLLRGVNEDELEDFVRFGASRAVRVRFIERYPTRGAPLGGPILTCEEARGRLERTFGPLVPMPGDRLSVEAVYAVPGAGATVGFIASATSPPCGRCSKLRVTAAGELLPCLFAKEGVALAGLLRAGDAAGLRAAIRAVLDRKVHAGGRGGGLAAARRAGG
ncbi:MAG: hypothetical protein AMK73_09800, partial [Planctomycetes bacterium SM23_32]